MNKPFYNLFKSSLSTFALSVFLLLACNRALPEKSTHFNPEIEKRNIHQTLDNWHRAAATGDEEFFFNTMTEDAIYLGTDQTERWIKPEFKEWSSKFFERDSAWDFTPFNRVVYISENGQTAWFEELLETWMGTCRGLGVLVKNDSLWKLNHYNLSLVIDNDKINKFIEINREKKDR